MKRVWFRYYIDFEKEEAWLNKMAAKGLAMKDFNFFSYKFEDCQPGEYQYRIELLDELPSHPESENYIKFMEENDIECVDTYLRWAYFRTKKSGQFQIYSDLENRIKHYNRIRSMWLILILCLFAANTGNIYFGITQLFVDGITSANLIIAIIALAFLLLMIWKYFKVSRKVKQLKNQKAIIE